MSCDCKFYYSVYIDIYTCNLFQSLDACFFFARKTEVNQSRDTSDKGPLKQEPIRPVSRRYNTCISDLVLKGPTSSRMRPVRSPGD